MKFYDILNTYSKFSVEGKEMNNYIFPLPFILYYYICFIYMLFIAQEAEKCSLFLSLSVDHFKKTLLSDFSKEL